MEDETRRAGDLRVFFGTSSYETPVRPQTVQPLNIVKLSCSLALADPHQKHAPLRPRPAIRTCRTCCPHMLSTSSLAILRVTCLAALTSAAALNGPAPPQKSSRRTFLAGVAATPLLVAGPLKSRAASTDGAREPDASTYGRRDPRTTSSFFGLAAPPIQGMWSYAELVEQAKAENLATIQTAVQHDCIVATTHEGMRFASMVADKMVPALLIGERVSLTVTRVTEACGPRAAHPS